MQQRDRLIAYLEEVQKNEFAIINGTVDPDILNMMLLHIGDPDPYLRDELIYFAFYNWITRFDYITDDGLRVLIRDALDDKHLFFCLGNTEDDTVFTRSFSALVISLILYRHRKHPVLDGRQFLETMDRFLNYYANERDLRGYVDGCGWAHSAAHGADVLNELALCGECGTEGLREILIAAVPVIGNATYALHDREDDRIARALHSVYTANMLPDGEFDGWIRSLSSAGHDKIGYPKRTSRTNARAIVRSLYFKGLRSGYGEGVMQAILMTEEALS